MPRKTLQSECRVSCDLAHVSVTAVKLKNVYVQCVTFNYRYFGRIYAYTELCLQASTSLHLSEYITKWPLVRYHGKIFLEKRVQGDIQGHFRPPIYCCLYPSSFHLPPPLPQSFKQTLLHESVATSWTAFTKFRPAFLVTWRRGGIGYMDEKFFRPAAGIFPVDGLVVAVVIFLVLLPDRFLFLWIFILYVYVFLLEKALQRMRQSRHPGLALPNRRHLKKT